MGEVNENEHFSFGLHFLLFCLCQSNSDTKCNLTKGYLD